MKVRKLGFFAAASTLAGCATVTITEAPVGKADAAMAAVVVAQCTGERWIGRMPDSTRECSSLASPGWRSELLFDLGEASAGLRNQARRAGLDRYCVFTATSPTAAQRSAPAIQIPGLRLELERDCRAVRPASEPGESAMLSALRNHTLDAIAPPLGGPATARVRLTLLDTHPNGEVGAPLQPPPDPPRACSHHGETLGLLARQVACGGDVSCPVSFRHQLALAIPPPGPACAGGSGGWISDLGAAVWRELVDWDQAARREQHLVLNLSLGWDGTLFGGFGRPAQLAPKTRAVYEVLRVARDSGVAVFAAAGNLVPGPGGGQGPLLPAGWEPWEPKHPVVFAVGGLTADSRPLYNSRPGALPRRASFGGPAVVRLPASAGFSPALTGTSVASAVVAAFVAATWARHPSDSPAELVSRLEDGGKKLASNADAAFSKSPIAIRHIAPGNPEPPNLGPPAGNGAYCTACSVTGKPGRFTSAHPAFGLVESNPQPTSNPCPNCTIDPPGTGTTAGSSTLTLEIDLADDWDWDGLEVKPEAVEIRSQESTQTYLITNGPTWSGKGTKPPWSITIKESTIDAALLHWLVYEKGNSVPIGSALSVPAIRK